MSELVERHELLDPGPATAVAGMLGVPLPDLEDGDGLPLTWHWVYLLERPRLEDLGPDGHPARHAVPTPPGPGRRRMWAGGSIRSHAPLLVGEPTTRRTRVLDTTEKHGRSGRLTFVAVGHTLLQRGRVVVEERQDILYREAGAGPAYSEGEGGECLDVGPDEWSVPVSPTLLFQFSALTYNGHRIHYDRDYARTEEGYPGLVVHGPLQAMVMAEAARSRGVTTGRGAVFDYRLVAPLFEGQGLVARAVGHDGQLRTTVRDSWGRRTAEGSITAT
jgi:3-methylfumaryl-CoA hydratase